MILLALAIALKIGAALLSVVVARRRREYVPVSCFLVWTTLADLARAWLHTHWLDQAPRPYVGLFRVLGEIGGALWLSWAAGLAGVSTVVFIKRRPYIVLVSYIALVVTLAILYPAVRDERLRKVYLGAELVALTVALGGVGEWIRRRTDLPEVEHAALFLVIAIDLVTLAGPYYGKFYSDWGLAQIAYAILYTILIIVQGGRIWASGRSRLSR